MDGIRNSLLACLLLGWFRTRRRRGCSWCRFGLCLTRRLGGLLLLSLLGFRIGQEELVFHIEDRVLGGVWEMSLDLSSDRWPALLTA